VGSDEGARAADGLSAGYEPQPTIRSHQVAISLNAMTKKKPSALQPWSEPSVASRFHADAPIVLFRGDCEDLLRSIPDASVQLVVTSPPYNLGKEYEKATRLEAYVEQQAGIISECVRTLTPSGSICWQVGNYVEKGTIVPLDIALHPVFAALGLKMRNRIVWHFEHGLHCSNRFSGRYETIVWYTKSDNFVFNLDPVRVPQKYPGKRHFKGPKVGQYSGNPLGKNPGDVWVIPNVKSNHVEKTIHPCQFPVELVERLVLSMTNEGDRVLDPFAGVGTTLIAANRHNRRAVGAEITPAYFDVAIQRLRMQLNGKLPTRPMNKPVYDPRSSGNSLTISPWNSGEESPHGRSSE
jgi:adenine-specific DNA-methyltransferase